MDVYKWILLWYHYFFITCQSKIFRHCNASLLPLLYLACLPKKKKSTKTTQKTEEKVVDRWLPTQSFKDFYSNRRTGFPFCVFHLSWSDGRNGSANKVAARHFWWHARVHHHRGWRGWSHFLSVVGADCNCCCSVRFWHHMPYTFKFSDYISHWWSRICLLVAAFHGQSQELVNAVWRIGTHSFIDNREDHTRLIRDFNLLSEILRFIKLNWQWQWTWGINAEVHLHETWRWDCWYW